MTQATLKRSYAQGMTGIEVCKSPCAGHPSNDRIAVCHVVEGSTWAGAEAQVATLVRWLARNPGVSLHAIVLHDNRLAAELRDAGADVFVACEQHRSFPRLLMECARFVSSRKIQVLHSHCYKENIIALAVSRLAGVPHLVRTEHGIPEPYSVTRHLKHWCVLAVDRLAAKYTPDQIIGVSSDLGEYWRKHARHRKVTVLRNGVDLERTMSRLTPSEAKLRLSIPEDCFVVGLAARLERIKRLDLFVAAAAGIAAKIPNSRFVVAGDGRLRQWVRELVMDSGLQDRVMLLGSRDDVYDVLRAMDGMLMCSDHEGIPMVVLEAMALGTAVVSRKIGGIPEVIAHERTGILVPSAEPEALARACIELYENPELRERLVQAARQEIYQKYSAKKNAESVVQVYRAICNLPEA